VFFLPGPPLCPQFDILLSNDVESTGVVGEVSDADPGPTMQPKPMILAPMAALQHLILTPHAKAMWNDQGAQLCRRKKTARSGSNQHIWSTHAG